MITTQIVLYFITAITVATTLYWMSQHVGDGTVSARTRLALSISGGALWPLLLVGMFEFGAVALYAKTREREVAEFPDVRVDVLV